MKKTILIWLLATSLLTSASPADAQQHAKIPKIGWLGARPAAPGGGIELFQRDFRKLGYVEGKNIAIESRYAENKLDRLPTLADELVRLKVDVLITPGTNEALAAKNATRTVPIVFLSVTDPVGVGLIDSLARPVGEHHGVHHHCGGVGRETTGVTEGNHSESIPRCSAVETTGSGLYSTMERKPTGGTRTRSATLFYGSEQCRQIRGRVQRGN